MDVAISAPVLLFSTGEAGKEPIVVAARSGGWVGGCSLAEIAGSNPTKGLYICCEYCVLCR